MNCRCGFLMSVRAGGGYECRRCGQTEQVPVKAPVNWAAAGATDQTLPPPPPAPVVLEPAPAPEPVRHVPRPPDPEPEVENPTDPVVPRDTQPVSRRPFGRGRSKP
jgi:hypothetical protein